jgi:hypothetical protein
MRPQRFRRGAATGAAVLAAATVSADARLCCAACTRLLHTIRQGAAWFNQGLSGLRAACLKCGANVVVPGHFPENRFRRAGRGCKVISGAFNKDQSDEP